MRLRLAHTAAILGSAADACIRQVGRPDDAEDCEWQSYAFSSMNADQLRGSRQAFPPPEQLTDALTVTRPEDVMARLDASPLTAQ